MSAIDEDRARAYRAAIAQGQLNLYARARRLAGSATAAQTLRDNWKPIREWLLERTYER
jgi:hypothetical protein